MSVCHIPEAIEYLVTSELILQDRTEVFFYFYFFCYIYDTALTNQMLPITAQFHAYLESNLTCASFVVLLAPIPEPPDACSIRNSQSFILPFGMAFFAVAYFIILNKCNLFFRM